MNSLPEDFIHAIYRQYGPRWDPTFLAEQQGEHSAAALAVGLEQYANKVLNGVISGAKCEKLRTIFMLVENNRINGFAAKSEDNDENYAIGIYSGTITGLFNVFSRAAYVDYIKDNLNSLKVISPQTVHYFSLYFSALFLVYHEFGHVFRGHLSYSSNLEANVWMEGQENHNENDEPQYTERRHLCECDADAFAGTLLSGEIKTHTLGLANQLQLEPSKVEEDLLIIAASAVHFLFCIFDHGTKSEHPYYPPPHLRSAIVLGHLGAQLISESTHTGNIEARIKRGLQHAEAVKHNFGLRQSQIDLRTALGAWQARYLDRLSKLAPVLAPFAPCRSK